MNSTSREARENLVELSPEEAAEGVQPHKSGYGREKAKTLTRQAVAEGNVAAFKTTVNLRVPNGWLKQNGRYISDNNAGSGHLRRKVATGLFLDRLGHQMTKLEAENYEQLRDNVVEENDRRYYEGNYGIIFNPKFREWIFSGANFEDKHQGEYLDVVCGCEDCCVYGEAGKVTTPKIRKAFCDPDYFYGLDVLVLAPYSNEAHPPNESNPHEFYLYTDSNGDIIEKLWRE